jgi:hypothetical protein
MADRSVSVASTGVPRAASESQIDPHQAFPCQRRIAPLQ